MDAIEITRREAWVPRAERGYVKIFRAEPRAARPAREWVCRRAAHDGYRRLEPLREVAGELIANAIRHGCRPGFPQMFAVRVDADPKAAEIDVIDTAVFSMPEIRFTGELAESGMGLLIVNGTARKWIYFRRVVSHPARWVKVVRAEL